MCCRKTCSNLIEVRLIDKAVRTIYKDMDITVIMDRLKEVDKLKQIILTTTQKTVFDYTPKPVITLHKSRKRQSDNQKEIIVKKNTLGRRHPSIFSAKQTFESKENLFTLYDAYDEL